ncbi:MAG: Gfo/Idh/MocA family oxidoreductase [Verrucomicrobia bacterium]|nr:Gfo/Idh/MocA family oxidoreductase [Verrucomicrobiota bacterium]
MSKLTSPLNRRDFIEFSAMAAAMLGLSSCTTGPSARMPRKPRPIAPGAKIRVAQVGCGGKGFSDIMAHQDEEVVAICDIDHTRPNVKKLFETFPKAKRYRDFRKMLVEMDDQIDAVGVATPDHMHFLPAYMAIMMGKHVYVQKPLTQTVGEARELLRLARLNGVCTQMGNQGHAGEGIRLVREWFDAGLLGEVRNIEIWTNRSAAPGPDGKIRVVWPQGLSEWPKGGTPPEGYDHNLFLGRAPDRPYSPEIHPFKWRGYFDYGCGALGDMACHLMDAAYWGLELGAPATVELKKIIGKNKITFPTSAVVEFQFPQRKSAKGATLPPVKLTWGEGGIKPAKPKEFSANAAKGDQARELAHGGQLWLGSKGVVYDGNDYCNSPRFVPESKHKELAEGSKFPPKTYKRVPNNNPHKEWTAAIRANNPLEAGSNFEYSVPFTEMVCLGVISTAVGGKFTWDAAAMKTNLPEADALLYPTYRKGWRMEDIPTGVIA